jgi:hypothetical protein
MLAGSTASAAGPSLIVKPGTFVGAFEACGTGYPAGTPGGVSAAWVTKQGLPDSAKSDHALVLTKQVATSDCSASGASITGANGQVITELGFDVRDGTWCGAGAPRFNVITQDDVFHFVGCAAMNNAGSSVDARGGTWTRKRTDGSTAFPPINPGDSIKFIEIVFDEGNDNGPGSGSVILDNIDVNGTLAGKPGNV